MTWDWDGPAHTLHLCTPHHLSLPLCTQTLLTPPSLPHCLHCPYYCTCYHFHTTSYLLPISHMRHFPLSYYTCLPTYLPPLTPCMPCSIPLSPHCTPLPSPTSTYTPLPTTSPCLSVLHTYATTTTSCLLPSHLHTLCLSLLYAVHFCTVFFSMPVHLLTFSLYTFCLYYYICP